MGSLIASGISILTLRYNDMLTYKEAMVGLIAVITTCLFVQTLIEYFTY